MIALNRRVVVRERPDVRVASDIIQTVNAPNVFTPAFCAVVEVIESDSPAFESGELVVVSAGELDAFVVEGGKQNIILLASTVQAKFSPDGALLPLGDRLVTRKDSKVMQELVMGRESRIIRPDFNMSASGEKDPRKGGDRKEDVVTAIYSPVVARGPAADPRVAIGDIVAFSPTLDVAEITVRAHTYHVVKSEDLLGYWPQGAR